MNEKDKLILFGPPGVGKSTVAGRLVEFGYFYYEADEDLLPEVVELNRNNMSLTPELRDRQHEVIFDSFVDKSRKHNKLVMAYDFMWERYRRILYERCGDLRWVYLSIDRQNLISRIVRPGHLLTPEFALYIFDRFEEPSFPVTKIDATLPIDKVVKRVLNF